MTEPPQRVAGQCHRDKREQDLPERLSCDQLERALLVGGPATDADRKLHRQDPDDRVDRRARNKTRPRQPLEPPAVRDPLALATRPSTYWLHRRVSAHRFPLSADRFYRVIPRASAGKPLS